jgi:ABC-type sugar transport system ATPase subunit
MVKHAGNSGPVARITLENVTKEFSGRRGRTIRALDRLSLEIGEGERLAIVGPSGSGKTTLLRIIAGLERLTQGRLLIDGRDATALAPQDRAMAMVFQRDALLPHLTARENIALGLKLRGHSHDEIHTLVQEAAEFFRLHAVLERWPGALSGGERQRTALARAFVRRPAAFLLDEPLSSLDAPLRTELRTHILDLHRHLGSTLMVVTHDQGEAMALGARVAVLDRGALQQVAEPPVIYYRPGTAAVAAFIGSPPMNLFQGSLAVEGGALWFHGEEGSCLSLCLTEAQRKVLAPLKQQQITVGLRAEHIFHAEDGRAVPYGSEVEAVVESTEFMGSDTVIHWTCGTTRFTTKTFSPAIPAVTASCRLVFDMAHAHFFDSTSGCALPC